MNAFIATVCSVLILKGMYRVSVYGTVVVRTLLRQVILVEKCSFVHKSIHDKYHISVYKAGKYSTVLVGLVCVFLEAELMMVTMHRSSGFPVSVAACGSFPSVCHYSWDIPEALVNLRHLLQPACAEVLECRGPLQPEPFL